MLGEDGRMRRVGRRKIRVREKNEGGGLVGGPGNGKRGRVGRREKVGEEERRLEG